MIVIIGIDPGATGGIGVLPIGEDSGEPSPFKLSDLTEKDISDLLWKIYLDSGEQVFGYLESVHSMPKQGVSSSFKFGRNYGFLRGCLVTIGIPFDDVTPQKWQKFMGCMTKGDKNITKQRAQQLFPQLKCTHATSDAILIAEYGRRIRMGLPPEIEHPLLECWSENPHTETTRESEGLII